MSNTVALGWADNGTVSSGFVAYVSTLLINRPESIKYVFCASGTSDSLNKNRVIEMFLDGDADWLLLLSPSLILELEEFDKIVESLDSEKYPVLGCIYFSPNNGLITPEAHVSRSTPNEKITSTISPEEISSGVIMTDLEYLGTGCVAIHRDVLRSIQAGDLKNPTPWFQEGWNYGTETWEANDVYFSNAVKKLSVKLAVHTGINVKQIKETIISRESVFAAIDEHNSLHQNESQGSPIKKSWFARRQDAKRTYL